MKLSNLTLVAALSSAAVSGVAAQNTRGAATEQRTLKVDEEELALAIKNAIDQMTAMINNVDAKATAAINAVDAKADAVTTKAEMNAAEIAANKAAIAVNDAKLYGIAAGTTVVDKITADIAAHDASTNPHANSVGEFIQTLTSIKYP